MGKDEDRRSKKRRDKDSDNEGRRRSRKRRDDDSSEEEERKDGEDRRSKKRRDDDSDRDGRRHSRKRRDESSSEEEERRKPKKRRDDDSDGEERRRKKHKKKRRHRRTRDSGSDDSSDSDTDGSTPDVPKDKLQEYMRKKAERKALKVAKKLKTSVVSGYTNESNPFGDVNLTERFVWRKKLDKDIEGGMDLKEISAKAEKRRQQERMAEVEKVKKRREERALEKAQREDEMALLSRERARAEFQDFEKKEDEFHFEQSKVRAEIRLREGRAKPIDVLARNLNLSDDFDIEINEPYKIYKGLTVGEMEELQEDIKMHMDLDRGTELSTEFWQAMMVICEHELAEGRKRDILDRARVRGEEPPPELMVENFGLHKSVDEDVQAMLTGKSYKELLEMETGIDLKMKNGTAKVVEYWEAVLKRLQIYKSKARLREIHQQLLRQHLARLQGSLEAEEDAYGEEEGFSEEEGSGLEEDRRRLGRGKEAAEPGSYSPQLLTEEEAAAEGLPVEGEARAKDSGAAEPGSFSPELLHDYEGEGVVDEDADRQDLERKRIQVLEQEQRKLQQAAFGAGPNDDGELSAREKALAIKAMGGLDEGEVTLGSGAEVPLDSQVYWWHDKYRPRKPKYFNRVHTGYEWNKYNQTHYDHDNPPPKIVQGYKFNIFYPDLMDKSKAPTYTTESDGSNGETCLIRFHAGPPYEDIAFRVVNKEWEYSHKKGFKSTFERGILHLYINFKRYRYRR